MEITYVIIISIVAYVLGAITKLFIEKVPNKFIPIQNVVVGIISKLISYYCKIETNLLQAIVLCLIATMGAGGIAALLKLAKTTDYNEQIDIVVEE